MYNNTFRISIMYWMWALTGILYPEVIAALQVADLTWGRLYNMYTYYLNT